MYLNKEVILTDQAPMPIGPYSQAILIKEILFVSGQIPIDPATGNVVSGDIVAQTQQVMKNLSAVLLTAGATFANVVKTTIFLKDMATFVAVNEVYGSYFIDKFPARETVEVARLPKDVSVEISCMAVLA